MRAQTVAPWSSAVALVAATLIAGLTGACERAQRVAELSGSPSTDAREAVTPVRDMPWRRAIDEVARRLDRGDPPAVVAAVLGRVTEHAGGIGVESTLPWAQVAEIWVRDKDVGFALLMVPRLPASELEAGAGPCEGAALLGDFGDGHQLICRPVPTVRGTMTISATTDPEAGGHLDHEVVDYLTFRWRPNDGAPVPQPRSP